MMRVSLTNAQVTTFTVVEDPSICEQMVRLSVEHDTVLRGHARRMLSHRPVVSVNVLVRSDTQVWASDLPQGKPAGCRSGV